MTSSFDQKAVEKNLRRLMVSNHDTAPVETLAALSAIWAQAATMERMDFLVDKHGDGFQEPFGKALDRAGRLINKVARRMAFTVSKEECYSALRPLVRFVVSFVKPDLVEDEHSTLFAKHPSGNLSPSVNLLKHIAPHMCFLWKRREVLFALKWEPEPLGAPASSDVHSRALEVCRAKVDAVASDSFMDRVRNHAIALHMPAWTPSIPSVKPYIRAGDFYQAMRDSAPLDLNEAYRKCSTPPLLVFRDGEEVTAQREVMLALIMCGRSVDFVDERKGERLCLPVARNTVAFVAGQYTAVRTPPFLSPRAH